MEQTVSVVEPEQHRSDNLAARLRLLPIAKSADHTVGAAISFDLLHAVAATGLVRKIQPFRDYAVAATAGRCKPKLGIAELPAGWGKAEQGNAGKVTSSKVLQLQTPI